MNEGDTVQLRVTIARINDEQALVEIASMEGPYSLRVPVGELGVHEHDWWEHESQMGIVCVKCGEQLAYETVYAVSFRQEGMTMAQATEKFETVRAQQ